MSVFQNFVIFCENIKIYITYLEALLRKLSSVQIIWKKETVQCRVLHLSKELDLVIFRKLGFGLVLCVFMSVVCCNGFSPMIPVNM